MPDGINSVHLKKVLFLSDLDGTWLSRDPGSREQLDRGVLELKDEYRQRGFDLEFGYVTARSPGQVAQEHLPIPDWTITYNGGFIHRGNAARAGGSGASQAAPVLPAWEQLNTLCRFAAAQTFLIAHELLSLPRYKNLEMKSIGQVVDNPAGDECPFQATMCFEDKSIHLTPRESADHNGDGVPDVLDKETFQAPRQLERFIADLRRKLDERHVNYQVSPVYPFLGKPIAMFDVSAPLADKGDAVEFLRSHEEIVPEHLIVAGDGGNDIAMMQTRDGSDDGRRAIVVGGETQLREAASHLRHAILEPASRDSAQGVLDGLRRQLDQIAREGQG